MFEADRDVVHDEAFNIGRDEDVVQIRDIAPARIEELAAGVVRYGLRAEDFEGPRFVRLERINQLRGEGQLDDSPRRNARLLAVRVRQTTVQGCGVRPSRRVTHPPAPHGEYPEYHINGEPSLLQVAELAGSDRAGAPGGRRDLLEAGLPSHHDERCPRSLAL